MEANRIDRDDPRVVRTRRTVLRTALELLIEGGPPAVTVDGVVARSGVAKSTIYRHWATRDALLVDVMETAAPELVDPDPSLGFEAALRQLLHHLVSLFNDPEWTKVLPSLIQLKAHVDTIADIEQRLEKRQEVVLGAVLERGVREGVLRADVSVDEASAFLVGPLFFAHLTGTTPVTERLADRTLEVFVATNGARS